MSKNIARTTSRITKLLPIGAYINCTDNTAAKVLQIIGYKNTQGAKCRLRTGGVGMEALVTVKKGPISLKKKVLTAVIVRQKATITRINGQKIRFEDNAAVLMVEGLKKTIVKGVIAKEVLQNPRYANFNGTPV